MLTYVYINKLDVPVRIVEQQRLSLINWTDVKPVTGTCFVLYRRYHENWTLASIKVFDTFREAKHHGDKLEPVE